MSLSYDIIHWTQSTFGEHGRLFFDFFNVLGGPYGWLLIAPLVFWLAGSKAGLRVAFPIALAIIANTLLKWSFAHPRPYYVSDQVQALQATSGLGMPSGHAQGVAAQWCTIAYILRQSSFLWLAIAFVFFTGVGRIYLGVHTPAQVAVGWIFGLMTVVATTWLEAPVIAWCRSKSLRIQVASVVGTTILIVLCGYGVASGLRGDFQPPPGWESRWRMTVQRLAHETNVGAATTEFKLIAPTHIIGMGGLFLGTSLCGLWLLRTGEINPTSNAHRGANVMLGMPLLALIALVCRPQLDRLIGEVATLTTLGIAIPSLVGVVVPKLTARLFSRVQ